MPDKSSGGSAPAMRVSIAALDEILPLRTRILRPQYTSGELAHFPGDEDRQTVHVAVYDEDEVVGCATFMLDRSPIHDELAIRLRGMAVASELQGRGIGTLLMDAAIPSLEAAFPGRDVLWCNAREGAVAFYERLGFVTWGPPFDVPTIGPHIVMWRKLSP